MAKIRVKDYDAILINRYKARCCYIKFCRRGGKPLHNGFLMKHKQTLLSKQNKTVMLKQEDVRHQWFVLDATGKTLGRFAAEVTKILRGKHKATFTTFIDGGDGVIVINADKIRVTGNKEAQKTYIYHTGFVGGLREIPYRTMQARKPEYIIEHAVKGMMPKTRLANAQLKRLRIFAGTEHEMQAQQPIQANI